jgi:hypothetical protein
MTAEARRQAADWRVYARIFKEQGLATIPLRHNDDGIAKIPILDAWQTTTPGTVDSLDWSTAQGIGLVLGANSGNRSAIDIDDVELAADVFGYVVRTHLCPLMTYTARGRLHIHVVEPVPSQSRALKLNYRGRHVLVELKAAGTQVVIPPTSGYSWANEAWEPLYGSLADIWNETALALAVAFDQAATQRGGSGYPPAFQDRVARGERNNAIFVESCRLVEAGVPLEKALGFMIKRVASS